MKAAFGYDTDIQNDADPTFINRAKEALRTPIWIRAFSMFPFSEYFSKFTSVIKNIDYFLDIARTMIESRQRLGHSGRPDLLQLMLDAHKEQLEGLSKLSDDEIAAQSLIFLLAGFETTGTTLSCTAYLLATHPDLQEKLIEELDKARKSRGDMSLYELVQKIDYLDQFISEVLRLHGPAFNILRACEEEVVIKGVRFPKGVDVNIPNYCLHRDPEAWEKPEEFYPDHFTAEAKEKRHPYSFLPFGTGPRHCIGMRFALNEIKIGLFNVLGKFKFERAPETVDVEDRAVILMRPKVDILLKIVKR
jgi:cytochrome P450